MKFIETLKGEEIKAAVKEYGDVFSEVLIGLHGEVRQQERTLAGQATETAALKATCADLVGEVSKISSAIESMSNQNLGRPEQVGGDSLPVTRESLSINEIERMKTTITLLEKQLVQVRWAMLGMLILLCLFGGMLWIKH